VDARASGVFVKLFQEALRDVFEVQGAKRVQGFIRDTNDRSLTMHERMGFSTLGAMVTVAVGGVKWLHWRGGGRTRQWLLPRNSVRALSLPPV
jgi:L-amino acid N-acyltransferase YncA